ncbi:MAG: aminotransferase class I/II-fold pyridoxal phosphate-dependent enzyme [Anaerolineales bacterium]|nr:aminotransferase class I/II-fold pyridoxal phosphate-dependent enzyme [Anaerolineales bacterium]
MNIEPFALERYFAKHEFTTRYLLSSSDCESMPVQTLIGAADDESRRLWEDLRLGYTESPGHPLLRSEISNQYDGLTEFENVVLVPEEGIFLLMHALLEPGDHVVCSFPGYQSLYEVARSIGCELSFWEPLEDDGWRFDPAELAGLIRANTRLMVVNFPHNPTGYLASTEDFEAIVDIAGRSGAYLLSDEMYRGLEFAGQDRLPPSCTVYERAVSLSGLSKAYGLPGLRIGWLAMNDRNLLAKIMSLKDYTTICNSAPGEILAIMALRQQEAILKTQQARLERNLAHLSDFVTSYDRILKLNQPGGGSICFPRLIGAESAAEFCEKLIHEAGILLLPSEQFHYGDQHVRIGFGRDDFPEVLDQFGEYLARVKRNG